MKRTPKSGDGNRDSVLRLRVTEDEKLLVKTIALRQGFRNISKFIRSIITDQNASNLPEREMLLRLQAELGKEGSNLNQIARAINYRIQSGEPLVINHQLLNDTLNNIQELTQHLLGLLKNVCIRKTKGERPATGQLPNSNG